MEQLNLIEIESTPAPQPKRAAKSDRVEALVTGVLADCEKQGVNPRSLLLELLFRDLCGRLDRFSPPERIQFLAQLIERYQGDL
jgi:hypothetical protein